MYQKNKIGGELLYNIRLDVVKAYFRKRMYGMLCWLLISVLRENGNI